MLNINIVVKPGYLAVSTAYRPLEQGAADLIRISLADPSSEGALVRVVI